MHYSTKLKENTCLIDLAGSMIMKNKFSNFLENKIKAELEKRNMLFKNLKKEDISYRDTSEYATNKNLNYLKKILVNPKYKKSWDAIKVCISDLEREIANEKISLDNKNKNKPKVKKIKIKKDVPNVVQTVVKGKPIPYNDGLTPEVIAKNWHKIRPCDPNEIIEKKEKKSNSFFCAKFNGYY
jgi:hypothetical protein